MYMRAGDRINDVLVRSYTVPFERACLYGKSIPNAVVVIIVAGSPSFLRLSQTSFQSPGSP
jgi:hypothetical protein